MAFVAHAAIRLANDESPKEKDIWHEIKQCDNIQFRWKFSKNYTYHVIAGVFSNPNDALKYAKQLYVNLFFFLFENGFQIEDAGCWLYEKRLFHNDEIVIEGYNDDEAFFFWNKRFQGGELGPGVFEVDNTIDEFDDYQFMSAKLSIIRESDLNFKNVDKHYFLYNREAQEFFSTILLAENAYEYGMKMTIYCGLLEHMSENRDKDSDTILVIDDLLRIVEDSQLSQEKKASLKNYLILGRKMSARQKCIKLCEKYAKPNYGGYTIKKIINEAYSIRSAYSHGGNHGDQYSECAAYIKLVVIDVVRNYMMEKEIGK